MIATMLEIQIQVIRKQEKTWRAHVQLCFSLENEEGLVVIVFQKGA